MSSKLPNVKEIAYDLKQFPMPTNFDVQRAEVAALTCKSMEEFAEFLQLDELTVKIWCRKSSAYFKAINSWQESATFDIKKALAKNALGFSKVTKKDVLTRAGVVETLETETYYRPDVAAQQFWLKNRDPLEWKDKSEVDINVTANIRAWLVEAGGDMIDVTPVVVEAPLLDNLEANLIDHPNSNSQSEVLIEVSNNVPGGKLLNITPEAAEDAAPLVDALVAGHVDTSTSLTAAETGVWRQPLSSEPMAELEPGNRSGGEKDTASSLGDLFAMPTPGK